MIYMFMAGDRQAIKIGFADDVSRRRAEVQVGNHLEISLFRQFEGSAAEEAILHTKFSHLRLRGEWFSYSREMEEDVGLTEIFEPTEETFDVGTFCGATDAGIPVLGPAFRARRIKNEAVARALDVSPAMVSHWCSGRYRVGQFHVLPLERVTGISRHDLRPDLYPAEAAQ